jgi:DNA polymerase-3 subunit alpha
LWQQIETFAAYGFNKAHAASYGRLAYETAYMKANFPVDYMAAVLTSDAGDVEKIAEVVNECKRMGIEILPPSVGESRGTFTVIDDTTIRFGLYSIKNFGEGIADAIIAEREAAGEYTSLTDFLTRISDKNLNKKSLEALIQSGSLDSLGERKQLLVHIEKLLEYRKEHLKAPAGLVSLFGAATPTAAALKLPAEQPATLAEKLAWEKELLGFYVSGHPLDRCKDQLARQKMNLKQMKESYPRGVETVIGGMLESTQFILTKKGERMMFGRFADYVGNVEIVVFPSTLKENEKVFSAGNCLMLKGKFSERNGEASFVAERVKAL